MRTGPLSLRIAARELRGGLRGFRIFLLCLALGVAAIAGVGSVSSALLAGMARDGQRLLGGDVELRLTHRPARPEQINWLLRAGDLSQAIEMRAMAHGGEKRALVELKGVDDLYPLYGALATEPDLPAEQLLARRDGRWGAIADPVLLRRLGLQPGDTVRIGDLTYELRGTIETEPDRGADAFVLGPRLMVAERSLTETGLIRTGSLIRYKYKLRLPQGSHVAAFVERLNERFPDAGWRVRDIRNGTPGLQRFIDRMRLFLTLVGLTALLVGGLGVANAVKAFLDSRSRTIATLKCLGAPAGLVFRSYLTQIGLLAVVGTALGLTVGALAPMLLSGLLARYLPFAPVGDLYWQPLALAALFGIVTALAFALWPLARARMVPAGALFRDLSAPLHRRPKPRDAAAVVLVFMALAALAILSADDRLFALWFVLGAVGSLAGFALAALGVMALARRLPRPRRPALRLALTNLYRPGAGTVGVMLSVGLGLSVLVAVGSLEGNMARQIGERLPERAPAYFFIDIQPDQVAEFERIASAVPGVGRIEKVPSLRGRIVAVNGTPASEVPVTPEAAWALRGDRGLTYAATPPDGAEIVAGQWWPADYRGPPLVSLDAEIAAGLGIGLGDSLTINVLGREITARIASLRRVDWSTLGINFVILFAPGALEGAPHSFIATAEAEPEAEVALETAVTDRFLNVTAIRVRDALEAVNRILGNISVAVRATAAVTLGAGVLVLAGAVAAGHQRRVYEAVVLKVLGAVRGEVMRVHLLEFALLGLVTAALAAVVGSVASWAVVTFVMEAEWLFMPAVVATTTAIALAITMLAGLAGTWAALGRKPAPLLRNE